MKCPCEQCICISICRNKYYKDFVLDCVLVENFLYGKDGSYRNGTTKEDHLTNFGKNLRLISEIIKPAWFGGI